MQPWEEFSQLLFFCMEIAMHDDVCTMHRLPPSRCPSRSGWCSEARPQRAAGPLSSSVTGRPDDGDPFMVGHSFSQMRRMKVLFGSKPMGHREEEPSNARQMTGGELPK